MRNPAWPPERIEKLRQLWHDGVSASKIGEILGVTKNAVAGKAGRIGVVGRPSPIKNANPAHVEDVRRISDLYDQGYAARAISEQTGIPKSTIFSVIKRITSHAVKDPATPSAILNNPTLIAARNPVRVITAPARPVVAPIARLPLTGPCLWPMWSDRDRPKFRADGSALTCDAARFKGSYCVVHDARAHGRAP